MPHTVAEIAQAIGATFAGDGTLRLDRLAEPAKASAGQLALAMSPEFLKALPESAARVAVLPEGTDWQAHGLEAAIFVTRPRYAMAGLTRLFETRFEDAGQIHPSAVIDPSAEIGPGAAIGPNAVIGPGARIGANAVIAGQVSIAAHVRLGAGALLCEGVRIGPRVEIGDRFIAQPGCVIGADGFSFVTPEKSTVESAREAFGHGTEVKAQAWTRIASTGSVRLGDDVEVGANTTIDRGTIDDTTIGSGTKIDNLVQIGHNVRIGEDCLLCGHVGVAGSVVIGNRVVIGGAARVSDHIKIGDDVVVAGGAAVASNLASGKQVMGVPAIQMDKALEGVMAVRRLPRLVKQVERLQEALDKLTKG